MADRLALTDDALTTGEWKLLAAIVREFEIACSQGESRDFHEYLPREDDPLRQPVLVELVKVDQEQSWHSPPGKSLESYLQAWPELAAVPSVVADLVRAECLVRAIFDGPPSRAELISRFPDLADQIDLAEILEEAKAESAEQKMEARETRSYRTASLPTPMTPNTVSEAAPQGFQVGQIVAGRYEILEVLGQGGMGTVYRAHDSEFDTEVAIKVPHATLGANVFARLKEEAKFLVKLRHPNVCPIYDVGQADGVPYISMALIEGSTLDQWLVGREATVVELAELMRKITQALAAVHEAGFLHRDVKASNVMIDERGEPILMDFGLARQIQDDGLVTGSAFSGTPAYMAPEQVLGKPADQQTDVFSLGVIFYQLLTGELPFDGPIGAVFSQILECRPTPPSQLRADLDRRLEGICLKSLAKDRAERFASAQEMADALDEYILRETEPQQRRPFLSRKLVAAGFTGFLFLLACTVIVLKTGNGTVKISLNEPLTNVAVDGERVEVDYPDGQLTISVGKHDLQVEKPGYETETRSITIAFRGDRREIEVNLAPATDAPGHVNAISASRAARWLETGESACGVIISKDSSKAYVPCGRGERGDSPVKVFDLVTGEESRSIELPRKNRPGGADVIGNPHFDAVLSPDEKHLYAVNYYGRSISVVDLESDEVQEVELVSDPRYINTWAGQIAISAGGKTLVVAHGSDGRPEDENNDRVSIFDTSGGKCRLAGVVQLVDEPINGQRGLAVTSDGTFAYVATMPRKSQMATLYEIRLTKPFAVTRSLPVLDGELTGVALDEGRNQVLVGDKAFRRIWRVDLDSFERVSEIRLQGHAPETLVVANTTDLLFALCPSTRRLFCVGLEDGSPLAVLTGLRETMGDVALRGEKEILLANRGVEGGVAVVRLDDLLTRIVFASNRDDGNYQVYSANVAGEDCLRLSHNLFSERYPRWSPDGKLIAFVSDRSGPPKICLMNAAGTGQTVLDGATPVYKSARSAPLDWSPDGTEIAFIDEERKTIRAVSVASGTARTLLEGTGDARLDYMTSLAWGRADGRIFFGSQPSSWGHDHEVFAFDPKTLAVTQITDDQGSRGFWIQPAPSPDGQSIALIRVRDEEPVRHDLTVLGPSDSQPEDLAAEAEALYQFPEWLPDSRTIICSVKKEGTYALHALSVNGHSPLIPASGDWDDVDPDACSLFPLQTSDSESRAK